MSRLSKSSVICLENADTMPVSIRLHEDKFIIKVGNTILEDGQGFPKLYATREAALRAIRRANPNLKAKHLSL